MNGILERLTRGRVQFHIEPVEDAIRRSREERERADTKLHEVNAQARFALVAEGEFPTELSDQLDSAKTSFRRLNYDYAFGRVPRGVEVVLFNRFRFRRERLHQLRPIRQPMPIRRH